MELPVILARWPAGGILPSPVTPGGLARRQSTTATVLAAAALSALGAGTALVATTIAGSTLTIKTAHSTVAPKAKDTITGTLASHGKILSNAECVPGEPDLGRQDFHPEQDPMVTDGKGQVSFAVVPGTKTGQKEQYELRFVGNNTHRGSYSGIVTVTVK